MRGCETSPGFIRSGILSGRCRRRTWRSCAAIELEVTDAYFDAPRTYNGHAGMQELFVAQAEVFDPFRLEPEEFLDAGERVVVIAHAYHAAVLKGAAIHAPGLWCGPDCAGWVAA